MDATTMETSTSSPSFNFTVLESLVGNSAEEIEKSWSGFCSVSEALLHCSDDISLSSELISNVHCLCKYGLESLVKDHFLHSVQKVFEEKGASRFWRHFDPYTNVAALKRNNDPMLEDQIQKLLCKALEEISSEKQCHEKCLLLLIHSLQSYKVDKSKGCPGLDDIRDYLLSKYQLMVSSVIMASVPRHFPELLHWYFKGRLEELNTITSGYCEPEPELDSDDEMVPVENCKQPKRDCVMDVDMSHQQTMFSVNNIIVKSIGMVVRNLRSLGCTSLAEDAYASAIFLLLQDKVHNLAGDDYRSSVLESIKLWIQAVPLQFLHALLAYLGDATRTESPSSGRRSPLASHPPSCYFGNEIPSEGLVRWQLRLEYFAYETLQDLRIAKLFEIIVDYPDSALAIEDLKQCLEYTGQHSKLVDSFITSLKYRLLTAGASTNDILHQYVSTIKALRTIDPAGVFLEAVGEPIREYLRGRKDTIKCIVTMLTDGSGGNPNGVGSSGDSLLEELNRDEENQENTNVDEDFNTDDRQAWLNAQRWEPDPLEADPMKGSSNRRKVDILGMIVNIIGSKDQLVNEYRVMLAEKLLNKSDYDIDSEIRTLELLKIHFGESSMQKCEIMLNDLIDSKRTNTNVKAKIKSQSQPVLEEQHEMPLDTLNATIISSNFWPSIQDEPLILPGPVDNLLSDYAKKYTEIKTPRKLLWKKSLGTVKLELEFEDRALQFMCTPLHASIIVQFQEQKRWTSKDLAAALGIPMDVLSRKINFWISKGVLAESPRPDSSDHIFTLVEALADTGKTGRSSGSCDEFLACEEDGESTVASVEDQLRKEMTVYEKFITGMLTNFGSMALDRIHNTLKMFCIADPTYDKSLQQLQSFLSGLVAEEKLELRDGMYLLKK